MKKHKNQHPSLGEQLAKNFPNVKQKSEQNFWQYFNQLPNVPRPNEDGETHINVSPVAKTELGEVLWMDSALPFNHPVIGRCKSVSAAWDFVTTGCVLPSLRNMDKGPRRYSTIELKRDPGFNFNLQHPNFVFMDLFWHMLEKYPRLREELVKTELPFDCYMTEGELELPFRFSGSRRLVETLNIIRAALVAGQQPDFTMYSGGLTSAEVYAQFKKAEPASKEPKKNALLEELTMPTATRGRKRATAEIKTAEVPSQEEDEIVNCSYVYHLKANDGSEVRSVSVDAITKFLETELGAQNTTVPFEEEPRLCLEVYFAIFGISVISITQETSHESRSVISIEMKFGGSKMEIVKVGFDYNGTSAEKTEEAPVAEAPEAIVGSGVILLPAGTTIDDISEEDRLGILTHIYANGGVSGYTSSQGWSTQAFPLEKSVAGSEDVARQVLVRYEQRQDAVVEGNAYIGVRFDPLESVSLDAPEEDCFADDATVASVGVVSEEVPEETEEVNLRVSTEVAEAVAVIGEEGVVKALADHIDSSGTADAINVNNYQPSVTIEENHEVSVLTTSGPTEGNGKAPGDEEDKPAGDTAFALPA